MPPSRAKSRAGSRPKHHLNGHGRKLHARSMGHSDFKDLVGRDDQEYMVLETLYMKPDLVRRLKMLAQRRRKSKNQLIREILANEVEKTAVPV